MGRPKGSKNKTTLEREAREAREAKERFKLTNPTNALEVMAEIVKEVTGSEIEPNVDTTESLQNRSLSSEGSYTGVEEKIDSEYDFVNVDIRNESESESESESGVSTPLTPPTTFYPEAPDAPKLDEAPKVDKSSKGTSKNTNKSFKTYTCDRCKTEIFCEPLRIDTNVLLGRAEYHRQSARYVRLCTKCCNELNELVDGWLSDRDKGGNPELRRFGEDL